MAITCICFHSGRAKLSGWMRVSATARQTVASRSTILHSVPVEILRFESSKSTDSPGSDFPFHATGSILFGMFPFIYSIQLIYTDIYICVQFIFYNKCSGVYFEIYFGAITMLLFKLMFRFLHS